MSRLIRVGINGFGRIGRAIFRQNLKRQLFEVVVINDLIDEPQSIAYSLKYDSLHGTLPQEILAANGSLFIDDHEIKLYSRAAIEAVPWNKHHVDLVIGCTGSLANVANAAKCLGRSVKKVLFSDSPSDVDLTLVTGVNEDLYDPDRHHVLAASICDVVGTAPLVKLLDGLYSIESGFVLTLHPWLAYQNLMDSRPSSPSYKDKPWTYLAMGRASVNALIPKNTSIVPALERIFPKLKGKLEGMSFRVPTDLVSSAYMTLLLNKDCEVDELKNAIKNAVREPVLGYTEEPLVSGDYRNHPCSAIVDGKWIEVRDKRLLRLISWYDNEWGYSANVLNIIAMLAAKGLNHD